MADLFKFNKKIFSDIDFKNLLITLGIRYGDMVCVHSDFTKFGKILLDKNIFLSTIKNAILDIIGKDGTLIVPTFTYSFTKNQIYNKLTSKCLVGAFGEYFRKCYGVYRTNDPIFSHAVFGSKINEFENIHNECFGRNSDFDIMHKHNAKIIFLGLGGQHGFTYAIYIEQSVGVTWRYLKNFSGTIIDEFGESKDFDIKYFVRDLNINPIPDTEKRLKFMIEKGAVKNADFAGSDIYVVDAKKAYNVLVDKLKQDETFYLK